MDNNSTDIISTKRSTNLIANFVDGFADGWYMAIKESFKMELDIKLTPRKKNKQSYDEWTQGPYYCFSEGQIIYDTKVAYNCWIDALKCVTTACQIVEAKPNMPIKTENATTDKPEYKVLDGYVRFMLFKPDDEQTKLIPYVDYKFSQNDFVRFLKTGQLGEAIS